MSIFDSVKHEIEHGLKSLGDGIKHDLTSATLAMRPRVRSRILKTCGNPRWALKKAENDGLHSLKQAGADIEHEGQQLLTDIKSAGLAAAAKEVLETAYALAEAVEPDQMQLTLGPVIIEVDDIPSKMDVLKGTGRASRHIPGKSIVAAIRALDAGSRSHSGRRGAWLHCPVRRCQDWRTTDVADGQRDLTGWKNCCMIISVSDHGSTAPTDPAGFRCNHAPTFTRDEIGRPIPNWVTYAAPFAERTRGYVSGLDATGQAARTYSTVYRMRADADGGVGPAAD